MLTQPVTPGHSVPLQSLLVSTYVQNFSYLIFTFLFIALVYYVQTVSWYLFLYKMSSINRNNNNNLKKTSVNFYIYYIYIYYTFFVDMNIYKKIKHQKISLS